MSCVADNMDTIRPFGDVPRKLASSVKRSLVAARALVKALKTGHEIANQMTKVSLSSIFLLYGRSDLDIFINMFNDMFMDMHG